MEALERGDGALLAALAARMERHVSAGSGNAVPIDGGASQDPTTSLDRLAAVAELLTARAADANPMAEVAEQEVDRLSSSDGAYPGITEDRHVEAVMVKMRRNLVAAEAEVLAIRARSVVAVLRHRLRPQSGAG